MNLNLRFGKPTSYDYETLIDQFSGTSIHSFRTSSIPLVQFWKNTDVRLNELLSKLNLQTGNVSLCFEYPTSPKKGKGGASMTDLMMISDNAKIAIEAKFTEYAETKEELIRQWKKGGSSERNRELVLQYWSELIMPFSKGIDMDFIQDVEYQFYHRTASACKDVKNTFVVYQIFYDEATKEYLNDYEEKLRAYVKTLNPNEKLNFYIWEIETFQKIQECADTNPFKEMKKKNIYEFGKMDFYKIG